MRAKLLTICGPSGAGKSSLASALAKSYPTYIERTEQNPHLRGLLTGGYFDATANQNWFLSETAAFIALARSDQPLVLDQDPAGIVLGYGRLFHEEGAIAADEYACLLQRLKAVEQDMLKWQFPRMVLFLDAPSDVLRERVQRRRGLSHTPSKEWFEKVRTYFKELAEGLPVAARLSTAELPPDQVLSRALQLMRANPHAEASPSGSHG